MAGVRDDGSPEALLVLIGEAPGKNEMLHGRPFVGASGHRLEVWWRMVGLNRSDFYITNVLDYMPANIDKVPREELEAAFVALHKRLAALKGPIVIVPTGNYALYALTGKGKVSWHRKDGRHERPGIMDWRGSILPYHRGEAGSLGVVKVIPTIHPAHVLRTPGLERRTMHDWSRIADEVKYTDFDLPKRVNKIKPTLDEVREYADLVIEQGWPIAIDIETPKGRTLEYQMIDGSWQAKVRKEDADKVAKYKSGKKKGQPKSRWRGGYAYIGCIGFANNPGYSLTVPLTLDYWKDPAILALVKLEVSRILASKLQKVMQNGVFDATWLRREGYPLKRWLWDTRAMHHALDPRDDHDLAYMASIFTGQPFWKHEAKDPDEIEKYATNSEALWAYNGIDCCVTIELFQVFHKMLDDRGMIPFYLRHYGDMLAPLVDIGMRGVRANVERMEEERKELDVRCGQIAASLRDAVGLDLVGKGGGLSNDRLKFVLYGARGFEGTRQQASYAKLAAAFPAALQLNLPPIRKKNTKGERAITVDEITLRRLILKHEKLKHLGPLLLEHRRNRKKAEFLDVKAVDSDGKMRCMYSLCTEAARLASSGVPWGTGRNLQNIDRELRYVFLPD